MWINTITPSGTTTGEKILGDNCSPECGIQGKRNMAVAPTPFSVDTAGSFAQVGRDQFSEVPSGGTVAGRQK